jgi:hypothetical protein
VPESLLDDLFREPMIGPVLPPHMLGKAPEFVPGEPPDERSRLQQLRENLPDPVQNALYLMDLLSNVLAEGHRSSMTGDYDRDIDWDRTGLEAYQDTYEALGLPSPAATAAALGSVIAEPGGGEAKAMGTAITQGLGFLAPAAFARWLARGTTAAPDVARIATPALTRVTGAEDINRFIGSMGEASARGTGLIEPMTPQGLRNIIAMGGEARIGPDGAGYVVDGHGRIRAIFSPTGDAAQELAAARGAVASAPGMRHGQLEVEVFDYPGREGNPADMFRRLGFEEAERTPFSDAYAPAGWDVEAMGRPDSVVMHRATRTAPRGEDLLGAARAAEKPPGGIEAELLARDDLTDRQRQIIQSGRYSFKEPTRIDRSREHFGYTVRGTEDWPTIELRGRVESYNPEIATPRDTSNPWRVQYDLAPGWSETIPSDPDLIYRGMSWEEWEAISRRGYIESLGDYNIGESQRGLTFFSDRPDTAQAYSSGFAPTPYRATPERPGVVVAIRARPGAVDPTIGKGEIGVPGRIDADEIVHVWEGQPYASGDDGFFEIITEYGRVTDGGTHAPTQYLAWRELVADPVSGLLGAP